VSAGDFQISNLSVFGEKATYALMAGCIVWPESIKMGTQLVFEQGLAPENLLSWGFLGQFFTSSKSSRRKLRCGRLLGNNPA
jgi:hypothetical protein